MNHHAGLLTTIPVSGTQTDFGNDLKVLVRRYWDAHPCGSRSSRNRIGSRDFFEDLARHRYDQEPHIPQVARFQEWRGKAVLEIGCGLGTDLLQFARAGAHVTGIDLSPKAVGLAAGQFQLHGLDGRFQVGDAENLGFHPEVFDLVYANGVLHHTPNIEKAVAEAHRMLRPGGTAIVMLYHKHSYNYWVNICLCRRLAFALLRRGFPPAILSRLAGVNMDLVEEYGRVISANPQWTRQDLLNNNTDGPGNPLSKVYTRAEALRIFHRFQSVRTEIRWLVGKNVPLLGKYIPRTVDSLLGRLVGWALYVIAIK